jgi:hypothetical protein
VNKLEHANRRPKAFRRTPYHTGREHDLLIECYRSSLFGREHTEVQPAIIATAITLVVAVAGVWCFAKAEGTFTDSI